MNLVVVDPVAVEFGEGVEGLSPGRDSGGEVVAGPAFLFHDEVEDFHSGLFGGEVSASAGGLTEPAVQRLDHVGGVDQLTDLRVERQERGELLPAGRPQLDDRRVFDAPAFGELLETGRGGFGG